MGGLIGIYLSVAVAVITYPTLGLSALPPLAYVALQMVETYFVTPWILGRRLEMNTVAILIFLALSAWMWGIVGAIIGVPVLVVLQVFSDNVPSLAPLGDFLSAEAPAIDENGAELDAAPGSEVPRKRVQGA